MLCGKVRPRLEQYQLQHFCLCNLMNEHYIDLHKNLFYIYSDSQLSYLTTWWKIVGKCVFHFSFVINIFVVSPLNIGLVHFFFVPWYDLGSGFHVSFLCSEAKSSLLLLSLLITLFDIIHRTLCSFQGCIQYFHVQRTKATKSLLP